MISNISEIELQGIKKRLPGFKKIIEEDESFIKNGNYKKIFISVFDHWLKSDEADNQIFVDDNIEELNSRREKYKTVVEKLYSLTDLYLWKYKRNYRFHIQKPLTLNDALRKCDFNNLWSQRGRQYSFVLPEFSAIYNEEWDWTNIIWYLDEEKIQPILDIAKSSGLYILKSKN